MSSNPDIMVACAGFKVADAGAPLLTRPAPAIIGVPAQPGVRVGVGALAVGNLLRSGLTRARRRREEHRFEILAGASRYSTRQSGSRSATE